jgi:hypothetical protein
MPWRVVINRSHVVLWGRWVVAWWAWVGWALILGAHLHPRWDEILFAICLPCVVLIPYTIATFILAWIKLWLPLRWYRAPVQNEHVHNGTTRPDNQRPCPIASTAAHARAKSRQLKH